MNQEPHEIPPLTIDLNFGLESEPQPARMSVAKVIGPTATELTRLTPDELASINPDGKTNWSCPAFQRAVKERQLAKLEFV